jgi:rubrerythrin
LTPEQKTKLALYDNQTGALAEWDPEELARIANAGDVDLSQFFHDDELAGILEAFAKGQDKEAPDDFKEVDENIPTEHTCPKCGYSWSGGE